MDVMTSYSVQFVGEDGVWGVKSSKRDVCFAWFAEEDIAKEYISMLKNRVG